MASNYSENIEKAKSRIGQVILEALDNNIVPWRVPWNKQGMDKGLLAKGAYKGQNMLITAVVRMLRGYKSKVWLTWARFMKLQKDNPDMKMVKGSKAVTILLWKIIDKKDSAGNVILNANGEPKKVGWLTAYSVYNGDCFTGFDFSKYEPAEPDPLDENDVILAEDALTQLKSSYKNCPKIIHDQIDAGGYDPRNDQVHLTPICQFKSTPEYVSTLAHELAHSTGHETRLNRPSMKDYFKETKIRGYEELVAEMGACIVCAKFHMLPNTLDNSAAYIKHWKEALGNNPSWFWDAYGDASKAADLILGQTKESKNTESEDIA